MNYFSNNKLWPLIVLLLILINTATLVFFWVSNKKDLPTQGEGNRGSAAAYLTKELQLDAAQQAAYKTLREEHQQSMQAIRRQLKEAKDVFFNLLNSPEVDEATINQYASKTAGIEQQLDVLTFHHFKEVRALCNDEQKIKFDGIIKKVVQMMGPQRPPRRNGNDSLHRPFGPPPQNGDGMPEGVPPHGGNSNEPPPQ